MYSENLRNLSRVTLFAIAMGFLETAVVVYLRIIYYPEGFDFPLKPIDRDVALTEVWREVATIIMLIGIGVATGKTASSKFAYFLYSFAIWDIFYYVFLKVILDWPASLMTWDILFLIPAPWVGPVLAPCIISVLMIVFACSIIFLGKERPVATIKLKEWLFFIIGSLTLIYSFVKDYSQHRAQLQGRDSSILDDFTDYVPKSFDWPVFLFGTSLIVLGIIFYSVRQTRQTQ